MLDLRLVGHSPKQSLLAIVGKKQRRELDEFAMKIMSGYSTSDLVDVGVMNHVTLPNSGYSFVFAARSRTFPNRHRALSPISEVSGVSKPAIARQCWVDRQFQHLSASTARQKPVS